MSRKTRHAYVDRIGTVRNDLEADGVTLREIVECLDPERADPLVNPWGRTYSAAIRRALGH
jgi:hypothetical protein